MARRLGNQKNLADELGCNPATISKHVKKNDSRIVWRGESIDIDATLRNYQLSGFTSVTAKVATRPARNASMPDKVGPLERRVVNPDTGFEFEKGPLAIDSPMETILRHREFNRAEKERLVNEKMAGELISRAEIADKNFNLWRQFRDLLQAMTERESIKLASVSDVHSAKLILKTSIHDLLESIVQGYEKLEDEDIKKKLLYHLT